MRLYPYKERLNSLRKGLKGLGVDALWIVQPQNRRYISGFKAEDTQCDESSGSVVVGNKKAFLITDSRYTVEAEKQAREFEVITLKKDFADEFPGIIGRTGAGLLGFEKDHVSWGLQQRLSGKLRRLSPPVRLRPLGDPVQEMRVIKDDIEVRAIKAAADKMSDILKAVIDRLKPGLTESEVAWWIESMAREAGTDGLAFPSIVASGPNGALPHAVPTNRKLRPREPIVLDVGVKVDGYCCDMTRTVFIGEPERNFRRIYGVVRRAQLEAIKVIRPGVESTYPDSVARGIIREEGFGEFFGHALGHGVGLATHEAPRLSPRKPVELKEGMVVTVEPGIYIPGKGGVRLEELVVIRKGGPVILTRDRHFYDWGQ